MNRFKTSLLAGTALLSLVSFSLVAAAKLNKTGNATAGFHATGPAGLSIDGKTSDVTVADDGTTVTITVNLTSIDTGIGLRNKHTAEDLEAAKFPTATLKVARSAVKIPAAGAEASGDAKGSLTIHGQTKDVTVHYKAKHAGDTITVDGSTDISVSDFGVKPRSYLGVSIKPNVTISVKFDAQDK